MSIPQIAATLNTDGILAPRGKTHWSHTTIHSILTNKKYKGDALLQKPSPQTSSPKPRKSTRAKYSNTT
ncbi:MAG: recombinase family protein [Actinomycetaceae bacterium]|nr:recombinase family protein [Actinomycetaceae bacterium]